MTRTATGLLVVLLSLVGCATTSASTPAAASVLLEAPDESCERLGSMTVWMPSEILISEDALLASAVNMLRERAAVRGATHLVVAPVSHPAIVSYGTVGKASGVAYRCADWH